MNAQFRLLFALSIAFAITACSKESDQPRRFLFARADSQAVHDAAISAELAKLKASDPDAYLRLLRKERGDAEWLEALKAAHPEVYEAELMKLTHHGPATADPSTQSWSDAATEHWHYESNADEMRGKTTEFACTDSVNQLEFAFPYNGGSGGQLCLRHSPKFGNDVYLSIDKGQFFCAAYLGCHVRVRFDDKPILSFPASQTSDGSTNTIFIEGYRPVVRGLKSSRRIIIEAAFYQAGEQQLIFEVGGLKWE